jgi:mono/diheme cytochrome c family protein
MIKNILLGLVAVIAISVGGFFYYFNVIMPRDIPVPEMTLSTDSETVERGRYLAMHVAVCMDCHSTRNWDYYSGPIVPGSLGRGGELFDEESGLPGVMMSKNITPYALGDWSDGELFRAITGGLQRNGDALFPLMPYDAYRTMDEEDLLAILAYIRTLEAIENDVPKHRLDFPLNMIVNSIPQAAELRHVDRSDELEYGEYLAKLAGCAWCHSPLNASQQADTSRLLAGGHEFVMGDYVVRASNISSDGETGIGNWTLDKFIASFRRYQSEGGRMIPMGEGGYNTLMPWTMYADMKDEDLAAIFAYLQASEPIDNTVQRYARR